MILTTRHAKSIALAPPFWNQLGASMLEYVVNTDQQGMFSDKIEQVGSALDCARRKCERALDKLGNRVGYVLASEGRFGPHPFLPFQPSDEEVLYFIDRKRGFHLHLSQLSKKTNYSMARLADWETVLAFAQAAGFPSHALIVRPAERRSIEPIFKGIQTLSDLEAAFGEVMRHSRLGAVWVETDMRVQFNPTRMQVIGELAATLAARLLCLCPNCHTPGWGKVRVEKGLPCQACGSETELAKMEIKGCLKCTYEQVTDLFDGLKQADTVYCPVCNP
ncbi:hypothetical protein HMF3257_18975 [Spirosoma telluris]|uniref:DUF6671 domain-containing protein n=2 Tax=Spirosoma telluris TaxID=2183553 RepID=A0A327NNY4_9BACT|nr:hypothetical protein HMF3257_18975 [Spirosoma telluris]